MKTPMYYLRSKGFFSSVLMILLMLSASCTKEEIKPENLTPMPDVVVKKSAVSLDEAVSLEGFTRFNYYGVVDGLTICSGQENFLKCEAELIPDGKGGFMLKTNELFVSPDGDIPIRQIVFEGKMTNSGNLKYNWPDTWMEMGEEKTRDMLLPQILAHTGYVPQGVVAVKNSLFYKGNFDGLGLFSEATFVAKQVQSGQLPWFIEMVEGPIKVTFSMELEVVD